MTTTNLRSSPIPSTRPARCCEVLRIKRSFVYELLARGEVPSRQIGGRRLIPAAALEAHFTVEEACAALGIGRTLLYELLLHGHLPSKVLGRRRLIPVAALERWAVQQTAPVDPPTVADKGAVSRAA